MSNNLINKIQLPNGDIYDIGGKDENGNSIPETYLKLSNIANNLTTTAAGNALDARQGKILNDNKVKKSGDTMTGALTINSGLEYDRRIVFKDETSGHIRLNDGYQFQFVQYNSSTDKYECYYLPEPTVTTNSTFNILTTKKTVTISQGGTNAITPAGARENLGITPANIGAKAKQTAVSDPTASGTAVSFIDTITQNAQGVITPTKKAVRDATTSLNGLMSATDKTKLDGIASGAQVNSITGVKGNAESNYRTGNVNLTPDDIGAMPAQPGCIELSPSSSAGHGGYIDFHYNGSAADYTSRIIETNGCIDIFPALTLSQHPLEIPSGGTGATTPEGARANLGICPFRRNVALDRNGEAAISFSQVGISSRPIVCIMQCTNSNYVSVRYDYTNSNSEIRIIAYWTNGPLVTDTNITVQGVAFI